MITKEQVTAAIEKVVADRGKDFVYNKTKEGNYAYTEADGSPSCLVGCVMAEVDPEFLEATHKYEYSDGGSWLTTLDFIEENFELYDMAPSIPDMEPGVVKALRQAQSVQDTGGTWGDALATYEEYVTRSSIDI